MATVRARLPTAKDAPALARRALDPLQNDLEPDRLDDVRLIVSELVSNVVRHSGQSSDDMFQVEITAGGGSVRGRVTDTGPSFAREEIPVDSDGPGLGLMLVDRIATRWGVEQGGPNYVWFELDP